MSDIISETVVFVKNQLKNAEAGHDWFHIERVWKTARKLAEKEKANMQVVELAALLHDIADPKFHNGDETLASRIAGDFLSKNGVDGNVKAEVLLIIENMSFKNRKEAPKNPSIEFQVVQDADRLDAIGAIGIARAFTFGGFKNNILHNPEIPPKPAMSKEEYKKSDGTTVNHFYEKLLLLKDMMNTETARKTAEHRHLYMENFLKEFGREWDADDISA